MIASVSLSSSSRMTGMWRRLDLGSASALQATRSDTCGLSCTYPQARPFPAGPGIFLNGFPRDGIVDREVCHDSLQALVFLPEGLKFLSLTGGRATALVAPSAVGLLVGIYVPTALLDDPVPADHHLDLPRVHDDLLGGAPRLPRRPILPSQC